MEDKLLFNVETLANVTVEDCEEMYRRRATPQFVMMDA